MRAYMSNSDNSNTTITTSVIGVPNHSPTLQMPPNSPPIAVIWAEIFHQ